MTELEIQQEVEKVRKKILIDRWFDKPSQINTRILVRFMELSNKNTKPVYIDDLRKICGDIRYFDANLASMKTEARNNNANGKFFEEYERNTISLWKPVADFICEEYDKGGVIIDPPFPTPTHKTPTLNQILYGPPGTGKTYNTINKALEILGEKVEGKDRVELKAKFDEYRQNGQIEFVTFHQSFSYEEFVEGIKPKLIDSSAESSEMSYTIKNGIFKEICKSALDEQTKPYILIIDEINRGNISKILGELITLIEPSKRIGASDEEKARGIGDESLGVTLPYSNDSFGVPSNLYIIGTMNTADRSIALLDTALRRRFEFVEMMPQWDNEYISTDCEGVNLQDLLKTMNERIEFLLDREHTIGHSFFISVDSLGKLREVFKLKIIPLLQEYFYDDYAKIQAVLNDNGMVESKSMRDLGVVLSDEFVDSEKRVYRITDSSAWNVDTFTKIYE